MRKEVEKNVHYFKTSGMWERKSSDAERSEEKNMGWKQSRKSLKWKGHKLFHGYSHNLFKEAQYSKQ